MGSEWRTTDRNLKGAAQKFNRTRLQFTTTSTSEVEIGEIIVSHISPPVKATVICNAKVTLSAAAGAQLLRAAFLARRLA